LPGIEHGAEAGYRLAVGATWVASLRGFFRASSFAAGALMRAGLLLEGALRLQAARSLELDPHLDLGTETLWRGGAPQLHADFGTPLVAGGVRAEVPFGAGLAVALDVKASLSFPTVDGARVTVLSPQVLVGFAWRR
jgi:hypothetical protein